MKYMSSQETPAIYDLMCACWCLSIAVGRECYVARPKAPVRLNMYLILSSDSGVTRKSTSVRIATNIVRNLLLVTDSKLLLIESKITTGQLQIELFNATKKHGYAHVAISASELAAVLSRSGGLSGLPALLTDLYDCPDTRTGGGTVMMGGGYNLKNVYASFISASTPSWLMRAVTPAIIEGGFTSRCYFIDGTSRKRSVAWPAEGDDSADRTRLVETLQQISSKTADLGKIELSSSAIKRFTKWYGSRPLHRDPYRESFEAREDAHVLRFAAYLTINDNRWFINTHDIETAITIVSRIKQDGMRLFSGTTVSKKDVRLVEKIKTYLIASGTDGASQSEILQSVRPTYKSEQVLSVLSVMHELDLVQKFEVPTDGRPKTVWRATIYMSNHELYSEVVNKLGIGDIQ
jgi:hypothetical protein